MGSEVKRIAALLKSGAVMLSDVCPECVTPLFKVGQQIMCLKCNRPVIMVKDAEEEAKVIGEQVLANTEQSIIKKIQEINEWISQEKDPEKLTQLGNTLSSWLTALEKVNKLKKKSS